MALPFFVFKKTQVLPDFTNLKAELINISIYSAKNISRNFNINLEIIDMQEPEYIVIVQISSQIIYV